MRLLTKIITSFFFVGYLPIAPGTFGSIPGLWLVYLTRYSPIYLVYLIAAVFIIGLIFSFRAEEVFGRKDPGKVVIDVMDAQGRVVSTFSDEMPSGDHQYTVSGDLAKGVYFVRLSFGDQSVTKRVVIK